MFIIIIWITLSCSFSFLFLLYFLFVRLSKNHFHAFILAYLFIKTSSHTRYLEKKWIKKSVCKSLRMHKNIWNANIQKNFVCVCDYFKFILRCLNINSKVPNKSINCTELKIFFSQSHCFTKENLCVYIHILETFISHFLSCFPYTHTHFSI